MFTDSHFHVDHFVFKNTLSAVMDQAEEAGVTRLLAIGGSDEANQRALDAARSYPGRINCSAGYDRDLAPDFDGDLSRLQAAALEPEVAAIGECGLDYFHKPVQAEEQNRLFEAMLGLAADIGKPVVVHSREAEEDTLRHLTAFSKRWPQADRPCAVLHCFTGSGDFARALIDLGVFISFSGILTFKNAAPLREVAAELPLECLLIETDSPYLAPEPHRGERNQPAYVLRVAEALAEVKGLDREEIAKITSRNAARLFRFD